MPHLYSYKNCLCAGSMLLAIIGMTACHRAREDSASESTIQATANPLLSIRLADFESVDGWTRTESPCRSSVWVSNVIVIRDDDVAEAKTTTDANGFPAIELTLTTDASRRLEAATSDHLDRPLVVLIDDRIVACPIVRSPLRTMQVIFSESRTREYVDGIVDQLNDRSEAETNE